LGAPVTVIASGERWPDGSLRPAYEDLIGAAAIISLLIQAGLQPSGEARAAGAAFAEAEGDLLHRLRATASSRELVAMGFHDDAEIAGQLDSSEAIPQLRDGAFASWVR
jgi:2-phosphosulfolactate phosphatase